MSFLDEVNRLRSTALSPEQQDQILKKKLEEIADFYVNRVQQELLKKIEARTILGTHFDSSISFGVKELGVSSIGLCERDSGSSDPWVLYDSAMFSKISDSFVKPLDNRGYLIVFFEAKGPEEHGDTYEYKYSPNKYCRYFFDRLKRKLKESKIDICNFTIGCSSVRQSFDLLLGGGAISSFYDPKYSSFFRLLTVFFGFDL